MILVYGVGKTGSLIAYELLKKGHDIAIYDIDTEKARKLVNDLKTLPYSQFYQIKFVEKLHDILKLKQILTVIATNTFDSSDWIVRHRKEISGYFYIFSNVNDRTYNDLKNNIRFFFCGDSVNRAREKVLLNLEPKLEGSHWREKPVQRLAELRVAYNKDIKPWHYGAVYWAVSEITQLIYTIAPKKPIMDEYINDGSIDVAFPK